MRIANKLLKDAGEVMLESLYELICKIYEERDMPIDFREARASKCED